MAGDFIFFWILVNFDAEGWTVVASKAEEHANGVGEEKKGSRGHGLLVLLKISSLCH